MSSTDDLKSPYNPHDATVKESTSLRILNSSKGVRNYIPKDDFFDIMGKVFSEIANNLTNHCGPYSRSALVVSPSGGKYETNTFTKDGKNIVASMNFVSPIEEIIKEMLLYVGSKVDNKAGDGTTSSMFLTSEFFSNMCKIYKNTTVNSRQFSLTYKKFEEQLFASLNMQKIVLEDVVEAIYPKEKHPTVSVEEYQEIVAIIAAFQTLSSSGGDMELAKCMYDIYLQSPPGTWDYIATYHKKYETSSRYAVEHDPYDYWINAIILTPTMLNENLYSEYKNDTCDLLIIPEKIPGGGVLFDQVNGYLSANMEDKRENDLVIVCRDMDPVVLTKINNYNVSSTKTHNIVVFDHQDDLNIVAVSMSLIALSLCGGKDPYISSKNRLGMLNEHHVLHDVSLHYKNHKLYVNNLFDKTDNGTIHPFYKNPDMFKPFTIFLNMLQKRVAEIKDDINQSQYSRELELLQNTISKMCFPRRPYLMIGGKAHDHAEAIDVVRDCAGAINSSLTDGFVCGSSLALFRAWCNMMQDPDEDILGIGNSIGYAITKLIGITLFGRHADATEEQLARPVHCLSQWYGTEIENFAFLECYFDNGDLRKYDYINILNKQDTPIKNNIFGMYKSGNYIKEIEYVLNNKDTYFDNKFIINYPIVQPSTVFEQLFSRIGELMIKLITTECIIVPGAVYVKEKDDVSKTPIY